MKTDIIVLGAGVIGLSISYYLSSKKYSVVLIEQEDKFGKHTSSRNTEVIHAGIYYPHGSLKNKFCHRGKKLIYDFCEKHKIKYNKRGKIFIANNNEEISNLDVILNHAKKNGLNDIIELDHKEINNLEPNIKSKCGLLSPSSGVIDSYKFMEILLDISNDNNINYVPNHKLVSAEKKNNKWKTIIKNDNETFDLESKIIINSSGHNAIDLFKNLFFQDNLPENYPVKGCYLRYFGKSPVSHIIYPSLIPGNILPRVDATPDVNDNLRFGPNVEYVSSNFDYSINDNLIDLMFPEIIKYIPKIEKQKLSIDLAGVRPKIKVKGKLFDDFIFNWFDNNNWLNLWGIDSPGFTASLAIGEHILKEVESRV